MVGLLPRVNAQVALQRLQVTEARSTDLARIWLLTRVDQHVGAQMSHLTQKRQTQGVVSGGVLFTQALTRRLRRHTGIHCIKAKTPVRMFFFSNYGEFC